MQEVPGVENKPSRSSKSKRRPSKDADSSPPIVKVRDGNFVKVRDGNFVKVRDGNLGHKTQIKMFNLNL